jgi:xanthine dehydrogenase large subunit
MPRRRWPRRRTAWPGGCEIGGQDHFYLEGQISLAIPGEDGDVTIVCSTQHPSEVQHLVAHALHVPPACVTIEVRRMGGGFGGKESQASLGGHGRGRRG